MNIFWQYCYVVWHSLILSLHPSAILFTVMEDPRPESWTLFHFPQMLTDLLSVSSILGFFCFRCQMSAASFNFHLLLNPLPHLFHQSQSWRGSLLSEEHISIHFSVNELSWTWSLNFVTFSTDTARPPECFQHFLFLFLRCSPWTAQVKYPMVITSV